MTSNSPTDTTAAVTTLAAISQTSKPVQQKPKKKDTGLFLIAGSIGGSGSIDTTGAAARFYRPQGIAADKACNLYVADTANSTVRKITATGVVTTLAGTTGVCGSVDGSCPRAVAPSGVAAKSLSSIL